MYLLSGQLPLLSFYIDKSGFTMSLHLVNYLRITIITWVNN